MAVDHFEDLPVRPAPPAWLRRQSRYSVGPLHALSDPRPVTIAGSIRAGALAGLAIVAALGLPIFLVLGARAPVWRDRASPVAAEVAQVWTESAGVVRPAATVIAAAEARPDPVALVPVGIAPVEPERPAPPAAGAARTTEAGPALSLDLIPVLDDESGDLSFEEAVTPAPKPAPRPGRVSATAPRPGGPTRP